MNPPQSAGVTRIDFFLRVVVKIRGEWECGPGLVRIKVEEIGALDADEVV